MAHEAAKNLQGNRTRPRSIVPAIPLPYVQKRKVVVAPPKEANEVASNAAGDGATSTSNAPPTAVETCHLTDTDGTSSREVQLKDDAVDSIPSPLTTKVEESQALDLMSKNVHPTVEEQTATGAAANGYDAQGTQVDQSASDNQFRTQSATPQENLVPAISGKQPSVPKSSYNMPPAQFVPGQHALPDRRAIDNESPTYTKFQVSGGPHPMHHTHPSQGSLVFGGYSDSNNSSPAPPLSLNGMPQYPFPPPPPANGHVHHLSNGFQGPTPSGFGLQQQPGSHMVHNPVLDGFGRRQPPPHPSHDGYSPSGTPGINENHRRQFHDPVASHVLRSHLPAPHEHGSRTAQFPNPNATARVTNGSNGQADEANHYYHPQMGARSGSELHGMVPHPSVDNLDGLLGYIQGQFADPTFADYTLEVRYTDDRAKPMRIPGHNLLFARSPALKRLMIAQANDGSDGSPRTILIESADRFLCTDGFWIALQRLYGGPLLNLDTPPTPGRTTDAHNLSTSSPTSSHRFDLALGYAAAGQILQIPPVLNRGIEVACHLVNWLTLEKALDFALDGGLTSHWTLDNNYAGVCPSTYGPAVDMLIHSALGFLIANFPSHLEFDLSVREPTFNSRLPALGEANVTKTHNPRLSSIKFGDHPTEEPVQSSLKNENPASLISRVLINLPFQLLKYVLEAPTLGGHDLATADSRRAIMLEVISEREKRRIRVRNDRSFSIEARMSNAKEWHAVGWQEGVDSETPRKMPTLTRTWVEFKLPE